MNMTKYSFVAVSSINRKIKINKKALKEKSLCQPLEDKARKIIQIPRTCSTKAPSSNQHPIISFTYAISVK